MKRGISFGRTFQIMLIAVFIAVILLQVYMHYLINSLIKDANHDYVESIIIGIESEINDNYNRGTHLLEWLSDNQSMQAYLSAENEAERKHAYAEISDDVWNTTRFFDENVYVMAYDLDANLYKIGNSPKASVLERVDEFYNRYKMNASSGNFGVFTDDELIVILSFRDARKINLKNVGVRDVGTVCVIETINITGLKFRLNVLDDVNIEIVDKQNGERYSIFSSVPYEDNGHTFTTNIINTTLQLVGTISSTRIPQQHGTISFLTIVIVLLHVLSLVSFILVFRRIFVRHFNEILSCLDGYTSKHRKKLNKVGVDEFDVLITHINEMIVKLEENTLKIIKTQDELYEKELEEKNVMLYMYQMQIQPHFLYNTLGAITSFAVDFEPEKIIVITSAMADIFRYSSEKEELVELCRELDCIQKYIKIMQLRYPNRIKICMDIGDELYEAHVPKMILQPIVENALKHGILLKQTVGTIYIEATAENGKMEITVRDDGVGMSDERLDKIRKTLDDGLNNDRNDGKIGIMNVHKRIILRYGAEFGLDIESKENEYTVVKIFLPYDKGDETKWEI